MTSVKHHLLFILLTLNLNIASANSIPEDIAAACGEYSCDILFKKMKNFAKNGSPHAQAVLALFYRGGYGTEIDNDLSLKYMKRAAKNKLPFAQYDLGMLYRLGHSIEKDVIKSELWLKRSAEAGYKPAITLLRSEKKITEAENEIFWPEDDGIERITVTREKYTLSDLVDYLTSLGYARKNNTGSRIRGKGCGSGGASCVRLKVNSPIGRTHFNTMISKINAVKTATEMGRSH
jgi:TPR repeat protein